MFVIKVPKEYSSPKFNNYLLAKIINDVTESLSQSSYELTDKVLNQYAESSEKLNSYSLIMYYVRTFTIDDRQDFCYIGDNRQTERVVDSDKKIFDCIKLIEYGTYGLKPVPRISKVMNEIQENLPKIYEKWLKIK